MVRGLMLTLKYFFERKVTVSHPNCYLGFFGMFLLHHDRKDIFCCTDQLSIWERSFEPPVSWWARPSTISNWRGTLHCLQTLWSCKIKILLDFIWKDVYSHKHALYKYNMQSATFCSPVTQFPLQSVTRLDFIRFCQSSY